MITDPAHVAAGHKMRVLFQSRRRVLAHYDLVRDLAAPRSASISRPGSRHDRHQRHPEAHRVPRPCSQSPHIRDAFEHLGDQARADGWSHEQYLAAVLEREVPARDASGGLLRIKAAGFPTRKTIGDFTFDRQPSLNREQIAHLTQRAYLSTAQNVVLLGPPGTGKTYLATELGIKASQAGHRLLFATTVEWVARLQAAHQHRRLAAELVKLRRFGLIIVDEVGYISFGQDATNLWFQLVSSPYNHASLILRSNLPFARWGAVFGDQVVVAAMIDRIVLHVDVITLKASAIGSRTRESTRYLQPEPKIRHTERTSSCSLFRR